MAPGVALGLDIAAAAGAFSAATGDDFAAKMAARKAAYENKVVTGPDGGTFSLKDLAEPMGAEACGSAGCGAALDAYIVGLLAGTTVAGETAGWSGCDVGGATRAHPRIAQERITLSSGNLRFGSH